MAASQGAKGRAGSSPFLYRGPYNEKLPPLARVVVVGDEAWALDILMRRKRLKAGYLLLTWEPGQASALDAARIEAGQDIENVAAHQRAGNGWDDAVYDVSFPFALRAFHPQGRLHVEWRAAKIFAGAWPYDTGGMKPILPRLGARLHPRSGCRGGRGDLGRARRAVFNRALVDDRGRPPVRGGVGRLGSARVYHSNGGAFRSAAAGRGHRRGEWTDVRPFLGQCDYVGGRDDRGGAATSFGLARFLGAPAVERLLSGEQRSVIARWRSRPLLLLLIRLIPVISFNLINYAAGAAGVRWWLFLWTTALGILPITIVSVVAGNRLLDATWQEWTIAGVAVLVLGIGVHWGRRKLLDREESS